MGRVAYEPVWVFYRGSETIDRLSQLQGKRILVGPEGSGTQQLATKLLAASGVTSEIRDARADASAALYRGV